LRDPYYAVVLAAAELKRGNPSKYEDFVIAMNVFAERSRMDLVVAGDDFRQAQGKAQVLDQLARKLEDCLKLDEQYRTRT
jgi:hypothetical protein